MPSILYKKNTSLNWPCRSVFMKHQTFHPIGSNQHKPHTEMPPTSRHAARSLNIRASLTQFDSSLMVQFDSQIKLNDLQIKLRFLLFKILCFYSSYVCLFTGCMEIIIICIKLPSFIPFFFLNITRINKTDKKH